MALRFRYALAFGREVLICLSGYPPQPSRLGQDWDPSGLGRACRLGVKMHISQQRGTLAPGLAAKIIAMPANPIEDIESLRKINLVMKDGRSFGGLEVRCFRAPQKTFPGFLHGFFACHAWVISM